jgi:hypothetical protein
MAVLGMLGSDISDPEIIVWRSLVRRSNFLLVYLNRHATLDPFWLHQSDFPTVELRRPDPDHD